MSEVKCYPRDEILAKTQPRAADYAMLHGKWNLIPSKWNDIDFGRYKSMEEIYRDCLRKGVTWQELLNYRPKSDITL